MRTGRVAAHWARSQTPRSPAERTAQSQPKARELAQQLQQFANDDHVARTEDGEPHGVLPCLYRAEIPALPPDEASKPDRVAAEWARSTLGP